MVQLLTTSKENSEKEDQDDIANTSNDINHNNIPIDRYTGETVFITQDGGTNNLETKNLVVK
jgi:hypothetical protein